MKSMGEYTRQDPEKRTKTLLKLADRLKNEKKIANDMAGSVLHQAALGVASLPSPKGGSQRQAATASCFSPTCI